jgi:hypothetical protein
MSHDLRWRGSCDITMWILLLQFETFSVARDVTAKVVGSGALLAGFSAAGYRMREIIDGPGHSSVKILHSLRFGVLSSSYNL